MSNPKLPLSAEQRDAVKRHRDWYSTEREKLETDLCHDLRAYSYADLQLERQNLQFWRCFADNYEDNEWRSRLLDVVALIQFNVERMADAQSMIDMHCGRVGRVVLRRMCCSPSQLRK